MARSGHRQQGLTLLELMTVISILAILVTVSVPGLREFAQNNRAVMHSNEFVSALHLARSEAVTRASLTTICPASEDGQSCVIGGDWTGGWLVFVDRVAPTGQYNPGSNGDLLLRRYPALAGGGTLTSDRNAVSWRPDGSVNGAVTSSFTLTMPGCRGENNRSIVVSPQGRPSLTRIACPEAP